MWHDASYALWLLARQLSGVSWASPRCHPRVLYKIYSFGRQITPVAQETSMSSGFLFTSESVTEGHPDKIADQISDAIVDAALAGDPLSRVACETMLTTGLIVVAGEITTATTIDYASVA